MNNFVGIFLTLFLSIIGNAQAGPLTVRCSGHSAWGAGKVDIQIVIVLPMQKDRIVSFLSPKTQEQDIPDNTPVGIGTIQVNEQLGDAKSSHRHQFVVTRLPDDKNSLIGFYLTYSYVNAIRADLWEKNKPFLYFDSFNNEIVQGTCK